MYLQIRYMEDTEHVTTYIGKVQPVSRKEFDQLMRTLFEGRAVVEHNHIWLFMYIIEVSQIIIALEI